MERSFSVSEAAGILNAHPVSVRREIRRGRLQSYRVGRLVRVPFTALTAYMRGDGEVVRTRHTCRGSVAAAPVAVSDGGAECPSTL